MITFAEETHETAIQDIMDIAEEHYLETEPLADRISLNPDLDLYAQGNESGVIRFYTAREEGDLIGYCIMLVHPKPHTKDALYAVMDMIYVDPEYRHTELAPDLLTFTMNEVRDLGAEVMTIAMRNHLKFEKLAEGLGFYKSEISYTKYIKEEQ